MENSIEPNTKEYYELQSDFWFNECCKRMKERDELINDIADIKRKAEAFDEIVEIYNDIDNFSDSELMDAIEDKISDLERGNGD